MKILVFISLIATFFLTNCGNRKVTNNNHQPIISNETQKLVVKDSLEIVSGFYGIYKGIIPCADCEGILTELLINQDNTYTIRTNYLGKDETIFESNGTYHLNNDQHSIILSTSENRPKQYLIGDKMLIQQDMNGNKITGQLADNYILKKQ